MKPKTLIRVLRFSLASWLAFGCLAAASAREVTLAERKAVTVKTPARQSIVVPAALRGVRTVQDKFGEREYRVDFSEVYRAAYESGWQQCLEHFVEAGFDLDEKVDFDKLFGPMSLPERAAYFPGRKAGAQACQEALRVKARQDKLRVLLARPPWQRRLEQSGGFVELEGQRRPTTVWWPWGEGSPKVDDALVLGILREMPVSEVSHLQIDHTAITDEGFARFPAMPKLGTLWISPPLTGASLAVLRRFPKLETLQADALKVTGPEAAALLDLPALRWLELNAADLDDAALAQLAKLEHLTGLQIKATAEPRTDPQPSPDAISGLASCHRLTTLILDGRNVNDRTVEALARGLPLVGCLRLPKTHVTNASLPAIRSLEHLEDLGLDDTAVTPEGLAALADHPALKILWLSGAAMGDEAMPILARLPKLESLHLSGTKVTAGGVAALKAANPRVHVQIYDAR